MEDDETSKYLIVCSGNICRSPMAVAIFDARIKQKGITNYKIQSCGSSPTPGLDMTPESKIALESIGIKPLPHKSQLLTQELVDWADVIFCLSHEHLTSVRLIPGGHSKASLLGEKSIRDPYKKSQQDYNEVVVEIRDAINRLFE
eukprot:TRINITY_DN1209_c0_g1_i2.p1 TRINITY_DN1209_c0_g1~~TRINITY_DN1209_c0_g1_i2.p1  ORF type:complete len:164 (-),score=30.40 TRINITY_DN1209_c0_g1_i2:32-466(-)